MLYFMEKKSLATEGMILSLLGGNSAQLMNSNGSKGGALGACTLPMEGPGECTGQ